MSDTPVQDDTQPNTETPLPANAEAHDTVANEQEDTQEPYYAYPGPHEDDADAAPQGGGCGMWLVVLVTLFFVVSLVMVGLFLPPINLGERLFGTDYTMFDAQGNAVQADNLILSVNPDDLGTDFGVVVDSVSTNDFLKDNRDAGNWIPTAHATVASYLTLQSRVYHIDYNGTPPEQIMIRIYLDTNVTNSDMIDMYAWNQGEWRFVPSQHITDTDGTQSQFARMNYVPDHVALFQAAPVAPVVVTVLEIGQTISPEAADLVTIISPTGMQASLPTTPLRTLVGNPSPGFELHAGYKVMPVIRNYADPRATDPNTVMAIIEDSALREEHVQQLTAFAVAGEYDGIFIDYRDLPPEQRDNFSLFIQELSNSLHSHDLLLGVIVPAADNTNGNWETGSYDWRSIGESADILQINFGLDPTTFLPGNDRLVEAMLRWGVGQVNRYKILGGLSALSVQEMSGEFSSIGYAEALAPLGNVVIDAEESETGTIEPGSTIYVSLDGLDAVPGIDETTKTPLINYRAEDSEMVVATVWLNTGESLRFRMGRLTDFGIAGVAFPDLLTNGITNDLFDAVFNYKTQLPVVLSPTELMLNWRIEGAGGQEQIAAFTGGLNEDIVVTINAPDGHYAVNVDVAGGEIKSVRGGVAVAIFAPTPTPTLLPTNTPQPTATLTPTLIAVVATSPPVGSGGTQPTNIPVNPVNPGPGSIVLGDFEYGGQVTSAESVRAINAMHSSGMTWMKIQVYYTVGRSAQDVQASINQAHNNGFKILLSVIGSPAELQAGGGDYINQYAAFLGDLAAMGPDAIEVWNEPNLDREWPTGQISGANYTAMLGTAYTSIKSRNSSVIVISAAPSPTGAEAAFPGQVVNDDNFLRQMVNAGALQYLDCIGMHYNGGIVSPRATSGAQDAHYSRYLPTMLSTYSGITGGLRPICITELGYLTPEGYAPLGDYWNWGQNITVAQQAGWLAEAASYSSQTGYVKLMIVWNVDYTHYDPHNDPQAGFAIIRPDGSCPACQALAGAR